MLMRASDFDLGDLVQHLTDGPKMAVSGHDYHNDRVFVQWFDPEEKLNKEVFPAYLLKPTEVTK